MTFNLPKTFRNYGRTSQDFSWVKAKEQSTLRSIKGKLLHILYYAQKVEGLSASLKTTYKTIFDSVYFDKKKYIIHDM